MELPLGSDPRTDIQRRTHAALIARFGRIERADNKRRDPVWTLVQGVIGARTRSEISNGATDALLDRFGRWETVAKASVADLTAMLSRQTFAEQSARRLKECLRAIIQQRGTADLRHLSNLDTPSAMAWLEALPGVGRKIAAGVMNTSIFARPAIVLDSHHRRIVQRMGLVPPRADTARAYDALMPLIPPEWTAPDVDEHHMLVKRLGQTVCRPAAPDCSNCPICEDCETGTARSGTVRASAR